MKSIHILVIASIALTAPPVSRAQVVGSAVIGISVTEMREVVSGWSAKPKILGLPVFGDRAEHIGSVEHTR